MEKLLTALSEPDIRGAVRSREGEIRLFRRKGVIDLYELLAHEPKLLIGGKIADRVIGRGAALLLLKAGIEEVFAYVMSEGAYQLLREAGVNVQAERVIPHIINRTGDDICPVEKLTMHTSDYEEAYRLIGKFLNF